MHRIAYLVYNYLNSIKQSQYLVIGPNPVFLKYIKSVLPELDVSGVKQCTYEEFAKEYIDEEIEIIPSNNKVNDRINGIMEKVNGKTHAQLASEFLKWFVTDSSVAPGFFELGKCCKQTGFKSVQKDNRCTGKRQFMRNDQYAVGK